MRYQKWFFGVVLVLGVLAATISPTLGSTFTTIDVPGANFTQAGGINDRGQIVGGYSIGGGLLVHGFVLDHGTFTTIDVPGANFTQAGGINDRGQIVGGYHDAVGREHGFLLDHGTLTFTTIDVPGAFGTIALGI